MTPVLGTLIGEPIPLEFDSVNSLYRGQVQMHDGSIRSCLLKNIDRIEIVNELIANLVAYRMKLPVPIGVLTFVPNKFNTNSNFSKSPKISGGALTFSSIDAQTPNLLQRLQSTHPLGQLIIEQALKSWNKKSGLYGFDTWVANVDRHVGNILFGIQNEIWLIDHGQCFTKANWSPDDLVPDATYFNKLQLWYTKLLDEPLRQKMKEELLDVQEEVAQLDIDAILRESLASRLTSSTEHAALHTFLMARISRIASDGARALQTYGGSAHGINI